MEKLSITAIHIKAYILFRLEIKGPLRTDEIASICEGKYSYNSVSKALREIMAEMVFQKKARQIKNGLWVIIVGNEREPIAQAPVKKKDFFSAIDHLKVEQREAKPRAMTRPPAIYTNLPTPFGIADELHATSNRKILSQCQ